MNVFAYAAALYCEDCGNNIRADLTAQGKAPEDPNDENTFDSDDFPKGPYSDGGGEADSPQHCDGCRAFLENPLTAEGYADVKERIERHIHDPKQGSADVLREWADFYDLAWPEIGGFSFDRFDIAMAYTAYMNSWHGGQGSIEYAMSGALSRIGFHPGHGWSEDPWTWDSDNARGIYWALVSGETKIRDRRTRR